MAEPITQEKENKYVIFPVTIKIYGKCTNSKLLLFGQLKK